MNVKYNAILKPQFTAYNDVLKTVEISLVVKPTDIFKALFDKYPTYKTNVTIKAVRINKEVEISSSANMGFIKKISEKELLNAYEENRNILIQVPVSIDTKINIDIPYSYVEWLLNIESEDSVSSDNQLGENETFKIVVSDKKMNEIKNKKTIYNPASYPVQNLMKANY